MTARLYTVTGRVQGVGFRYWTKRMADQRDIRGWVANRYDGTVQVFAEGSSDALEALYRLLVAGPPASSVDSVTWQAAEPTGQLGFRVAPTF